MREPMKAFGGNYFPKHPRSSIACVIGDREVIDIRDIRSALGLGNGEACDNAGDVCGIAQDVVVKIISGAGRARVEIEIRNGAISKMNFAQVREAISIQIDFNEG